MLDPVGGGDMRAALIIGVCVAVGALAALAAGVWLVSDETVAGLATRIQASTAIAIAGLTAALAVTAWQAWRTAEMQTRAAERQVQAARDANFEFRFQREVQAMATVRVYRPVCNPMPDPVKFAVRVKNVSQNPAIQVGVQLWRAPSAGNYGYESILKFDAGLLRPIRSVGMAGVLGHGDEHDYVADIDASEWGEWILVEVSHKGLLGGVVYQMYIWNTDPSRQKAPEGSGSYSWHLNEITVIPSTAGAKPIVLQGPRG